MWVERGSATLRAPGTQTALGPGQAVWLSAGARYHVEADPDALCFPIAVPRQHSLGHTQRPWLFTVPPGWHDWLIHQFTMTISPLRVTDPTRPGLDDLLRVGGVPDTVLPLPRTQLRQPDEHSLRTVTESLLRDPALPYDADEWARRCAMSPRTLQRQFLIHVGITFRQWRTACRLLASAAHLRHGRDPRWVAHRVGFASASGFRRAFTAEFGISPQAYATLAGSAGTDRATGADRSTAADRAGTTGGEGQADPGRAGPGTPPGPRRVPPSATPTLVNNFHVIIWMYRGRARVQLGDREFDLGTAEAIWLPAGVPNRVDVAADSIMVPIQSSPPPTRLRPGDTDVITLHDRDEADLLRSAVAQYTWLRPPGYDELAGWSAFEDRIAGTGAASSGRTDDTDRPTMAYARQLLRDGLPPAVVSARLGYAHPSSFSRAFTRAHGIPPRAFQRGHPRG